MMNKVLIISGSKSDNEIVDKLKLEFKKYKINFIHEIFSAHRDTEKLLNFLKKLDSQIKIIVSVAGLSAALPGIISANCSLPVIGLPLSKNIFNGVESFLTMVETPKNVPVAVVGVDNYINACLFVNRILRNFK